jgi:hypothetical protein
MSHTAARPDANSRRMNELREAAAGPAPVECARWWNGCVAETNTRPSIGVKVALRRLGWVY